MLRLFPDLRGIESESQEPPVSSAQTTSEHIFDATTAGFENDVIKASVEVPVLVDLWAEWCGPCKSLGPILEKLAVEYNGGFRLAKIDVDTENGGMTLDPRFFPHGDEFRGLRVHQTRLQGGDASSDSYCFPNQ